ncbi:hypothetical protein SDRG_10838 [Saprolegnia diclina VS20]|uniref:Acid phosphatase n=1 Tax=Saprolegnia diclina (strain VS20) TaxID=1156394 RepID=T0RH82_SAPDV|nr:hypothetical protein SDRG_10838 [Saprolegnia diclina VS20]EQC31673.1 hypothetical protein SDRG_10838 [Saprolegnia diclina VS20]|eukprot:XP_008615072.1 hypothetical protein SDRG_10838 [Saprolegnia diclina VS20]
MLLVPRALTAALTVAAAAGFAIDASGYPRYCAKDMSEFAIQPVADPQASSMKLVHVQIMVRHGARTPYSGAKCWTDYKEVWNCNLRDQVAPILHASRSVPSSLTFDKIYVDGANVFRGNCLLGQLIDEGYTQQQQNGAYFRKAYVGQGPLALFQADEAIDLTNTADVYFESTDLDRTLGSGQIVVQNMFAASERVVVPWHTSDMAVSHWIPNPTTCPALTALSKAWAASPEAAAWNTNRTNKAIRAQLQATIPGFNDDLGFDCLLTQRCNDKRLPGQMNSTFFLQAATRAETTALLPYFYKNNIYAKTGSAQFVALIRARLEAALAGRGPRFVLSAVHDSTLMPLLAALGGDVYLTEWVPYASHVTLELYARDGGSFFFRLTYLGKPLPVPHCTSELCPIETFLNMTAFATDDAICGPNGTLSWPTGLTNGSVTEAKIEESSATSLTNAASGYSVTSMAIVGVGGCLVGAVIGYFVSRQQAPNNVYSAV